ncbi:MAG: serine/threonine-protein kinase [Prolixibacteraceae bacterium]|jgi:serine/threonine protein kinase
MAVIKLQSDSDFKSEIHYEFDPEIKSSILGKGGMGIVFKGKLVHDDTGKFEPVAIKALFKDLSEDSIQRAQREASIKVTHENVIRMYDFIETIDLDNKPKYHIISEYLDGETLSGLLKKNKSLVWDESLEITKKVLFGLSMLHEKGYVHRDIDPSNVMICRDGRVKLIDFGIAKQVNVYHDEFQQGTIDGKFIGKPNYASPEQAKGNHWLTNATSDIYSVGILLFELLTGKLPYNGTTYEVIKGHLERAIPINELPLVSENKIISDGLKYIIKKATDKVQDQRYQTASDFIADIEKVLKGKRPDLPKANKLFYMIPVAVLFAVGIFMYLSHSNQAYIKQIAQANTNLIVAKYSDALADYKKAYSIQSSGSIGNKIKMLEILTQAVERYVNSDYVKADSLFQIAAEMNSSDAYYYMGEMSYDGIGVPKDFKKGFSYTTKAVELGNRLADYRLGLIYQNGVGDSIDRDKALRYFDQAGRLIDRGVDANNPELQYVKGNMYLQGYGVPKNEKLALEFYEKAAAQNYSQAQFQLYEILKNSDKNTAMQWLNKSAEKGYPKAQYELGSSLIGQGKYKEGVEWSKKAADKKYAPALRQIGAIYQDKVKPEEVTIIQLATGIKGNDSIAYKYFKDAVEYDMDYPNGRYAFACKTFELAKNLIKTNPKKAKEYFELAKRIARSLPVDNQLYPYASQILTYNY